MWRSSGQGQGRKGKKVENPYSRNVKFISNNSGSIEHGVMKLRVAWGFWLWRIERCDRHRCHVTGSDHA